jgi:hypothetical protein
MLSLPICVELAKEFQRKCLSYRLARRRLM